MGKSKSPKKTQRDELCVFAFRLTRSERDEIHAATGPGNASKFARTLLVAAARNDLSTVKKIMKVLNLEL